MQPNIWALVNNAGMAFKGDAFDENVARTTLSCNYYGTERITSALLPLIHPEGHVINVSSRAGLLKILSPTLQQRFLSEDLTCSGISALCEEFATAVGDGSFKQKGWPETCYGTSKIAMSALTRVIARLNPKLHVNAVCPGWCKTDMAGERQFQSVAGPSYHIAQYDSTAANDAVQAGSGRQRLPQKEPTRLASALFLHEIRCHRVLSLRQVCFLLESNTTSTGKFFAERAEISWTDASF
jgi:NAD(P)-dependent dehydrogenase (short-subunit alcohol dehydrogenase family)